MKNDSGLTRSKKLLSLFLVSALASIATPSAALGEPDQSADLTVGVVITGDDDYEFCMAPASLRVLELNNDATLIDISELEAGEPMRIDAITPGLDDLLLWVYRYEENPSTAVALSFGPDNQEIDRIMTAVFLGGENSVTYSEAEPFDHPADLDGDGILSVPDDVPSIMTTAVTYFATMEFEVRYDAGCNLVENDSYGALFVTRQELQYESVEGAGMQSREVTDFNALDPASYDGFGTSRLYTTAGSASPVLFGSWFPKTAVGVPDIASFGFWGSEFYGAEIELRGEIPPGYYQAVYGFDLNVGGADEIGFLNTQICDYFLEQGIETSCAFTEN
jgi:hypothetical protein